MADTLRGKSAPIGAWKGEAGARSRLWELGRMMRVLGYVSTLSVGVIAAVVFALGIMGGEAGSAGAGGGPGGFHIDLGSLVLGVALGVFIGNLAVVPWSELPRRIVGWLVRHGDTLGWLVVAAALGAVLVLY